MTSKKNNEKWQEKKNRKAEPNRKPEKIFEKRSIVEPAKKQVESPKKKTEKFHKPTIRDPTKIKNVHSGFKPREDDCSRIKDTREHSYKVPTCQTHRQLHTKMYFDTMESHKIIELKDKNKLLRLLSLLLCVVRISLLPLLHPPWSLFHF